MQSGRRRDIAAGLVALGIWLLAGGAPARAAEYIDGYGLVPGSPATDLGIQPLGYPSGVISAVMRRDRILRKELAAAGRPLAAHAFLRGADMLAPLADRRLEAGLLGDMPTILAASTGNVWIVGLVKQTSSAVVAKGDVQVGHLLGKRIGYVPESSAHHTLLQGLASAGLDESRVTLVALRIDAMPDALERGEIDAFAAWEPAPSMALGRSPNNRVVFRGLSRDFFVVDREFAARSPQAAGHLVAGLMRAVEWMRRAQGNAERAARWAIAEHEAFSGKPAGLSPAQVVAITRQGILAIPSAPAIPLTPGAPPLKDEFMFLARLGKLPPGAKWLNVEAAFGHDGLARVLAQPHKFRTAEFDYED